MKFANSLLHPHYVYRVAGESAAMLDEVVNGETDGVWRQAQARRTALTAGAGHLCSELERLVPRLADDVAARRAALEVKRCLHNLKPFPAKHLDTLAPWLAQELAAALAAACGNLRELADLPANLAAAHGRELAWGGTRLGAWLGRGNLQCALSYGNPDLLAQLQRHFGTRDAGTDAKTARNLEDSLLQYGARASTKTSPLSSFTLLYVGRWRESGASHTAFDEQIVRRVEIKAALMRHLLSPWLGNYAVARHLFPLRINPTVVTDGSRISLHAQSPGTEFVGRTWGTGLQQSSLAANPMLACIDRVFAEAATPLMADALVAAVCARAPKLAAAAVDTFLAKLYELGYLISEQDFHEQQDLMDWAEHVTARLSMVDTAPARKALADIRAALGTMRGDDAAARTGAARSIQHAVAALGGATGAQQGGQRFRTPFYENCYLRHCEQDLGMATLAPYEDELTLLQQLSHLLDTNQEVSARMCDFFVAQYGVTGCCDDVPSFLDRFDALYTPAALSGNFDAADIAPDSSLTRALLTARRALDAYLAPLIRHGRDAALDAAALRGILAMLPPALRMRSHSYSYLVQAAHDGTRDCLVLNQVFGGRSALLSRFFEVLDDDAHAGLRSYLAAGADSGRAVELGGVFGFNANRHPPMSDMEVLVPPLAPSFATTRKIGLASLTLRYCAERHRLVFHDADGAALDIYYQGFLNPGLLPRRHRALALAFTEGPSFAITSGMIRRVHDNAPGVLYCPRVMLGGVVLGRRTWLVPQDAQPDPRQDSAAFYLAVRHWQQEQGLPERFFVRAVPEDSASETGLAARNAALKDLNFKDLKPFHVDLRSPRLVRLLQNMMKRHRLALCITELLPEFNQTPVRVAGQPRVAELHFELTSPARAAPAQDKHWYAIRVAYFDQRRHLMLEAIAPAVDSLRKEHGIERIFVAPHWKFGPHVDIVLECDAAQFLTAVYPAVQAQVGAWLAQHPSRTVPDLREYEQTARWAGTLELDHGPYLPLLRNNSIEAVPYTRPPTILVPAVGESKEQMLADHYGMLMDLYRLKDDARDGFFLTLFGMLAATAGTAASGMSDGYMSMRSHADYFFAAHDASGALQRHFRDIDARRQRELDRITVAVGAGDPDAAGLPPALAGVLAQWMRGLSAIDARSHDIVARHYDELAAQSDQFLAMASRMRADVPADYAEHFMNRKNSEIGDAFIHSEAGRQALKRPEFLAYRINVNLFYALLPLLEVAPLQKFLLCHLVAASIERVHQQDWREKLNSLKTG